MSPTKEGKTRPLQRHSSGCLVNTKMTSLDHCNSSLGERIDPTMPLESQLWVKPSVASLLVSNTLFWPFSSFGHLLSHFYFLVVNVAGTMEQSAGQMQSLCSGCAKRPATWWETAKPARTTTPSPSSKENTLPNNMPRTVSSDAKVLMTAGWKSNANTPYDLACQVSKCLHSEPRIFCCDFFMHTSVKEYLHQEFSVSETHTNTDHDM